MLQSTGKSRTKHSSMVPLVITIWARAYLLRVSSTQSCLSMGQKVRDKSQTFHLCAPKSISRTIKRSRSTRLILKVSWMISLNVTIVHRKLTACLEVQCSKFSNQVEALASTSREDKVCWHRTSLTWQKSERSPVKTSTQKTSMVFTKHKYWKISKSDN